MKRLICFILILCTLLSFSGCNEKEPFEAVSCGSGFYFNRSDSKTYKIKALDAESEGNYFFLEDYFVSKELGEEYVIKKGWFKVGSVYLAKKSDHYNSEEFKFNVAEYNNNILVITPDMNYVELYSDVQDPINVQIRILGDRSTPLDLTLDSLNLYSQYGLPVIFSESAEDINFILKGSNELTAGDQIYTLQEIAERIHNKLWSEQEETFYTSIQELQKGKAEWADDKSAAFTHFFMGIADFSKGALETLVNGVTGFLTGFEGAEGASGATTVILPGGASFSGNGSLKIKGGNGAPGTPATDSLIGAASGGNGGKGGDGILCNAYIDTCGKVVISGGQGGKGGEGSKGVFGLSGKNGEEGAGGVALNVAKARNTDS